MCKLNIVFIKFPQLINNHSFFALFFLYVILITCLSILLIGLVLSLGVSIVLQGLPLLLLGRGLFLNQFCLDGSVLVHYGYFLLILQVVHSQLVSVQLGHLEYVHGEDLRSRL